MEHPLMDLTIGPLSAPQVTYNPISGEFWLSWKAPNTSIDVTLANRDELRAMVRSALEAAADSEREETHRRSITAAAVSFLGSLAGMVENLPVPW